MAAHTLRSITKHKQRAQARQTTKQSRRPGHSPRWASMAAWGVPSVQGARGRALDPECRATAPVAAHLGLPRPRLHTPRAPPLGVCTTPAAACGSDEEATVVEGKHTEQSPTHCCRCRLRPRQRCSGLPGRQRPPPAGRPGPNHPRPAVAGQQARFERRSPGAPAPASVQCRPGRARSGRTPVETAGSPFGRLRAAAQRAAARSAACRSIDVDRNTDREWMMR